MCIGSKNYSDKGEREREGVMDFRENRASDNVYDLETEVRERGLASFRETIE